MTHSPHVSVIIHDTTCINWFLQLGLIRTSRCQISESGIKFQSSWQITSQNCYKVEFKICQILELAFLSRCVQSHCTSSDNWAVKMLTHAVAWSSPVVLEERYQEDFISLTVKVITLSEACCVSSIRSMTFFLTDHLSSTDTGIGILSELTFCAGSY